MLVGFGGFGLGRLSKIADTRERVAVTNAVAAPAAEIDSGYVRSEQTAAAAAAGSLVGSVNSTKYHFPWCPGAQRIKDENKILFSSKEEARKAGYEPAKNCKGLE